MFTMLLFSMLFGAEPEPLHGKRIQVVWEALDYRCKTRGDYAEEERAKSFRVKPGFVGLTCTYWHPSKRTWKPCNGWEQHPGGYRLRKGRFDFRCGKGFRYKVLVGYPRSGRK